jgi:serine/threonine-protein kinase
MGGLPSWLRWSEDAVPARILHQFFRADGRAREAVAVRVMSALAAVCTPAVLTLGPFAGWRLTVALVCVLALVLTYTLSLQEAFRRGWYRPFVPWLNGLVEVSLPLPFIAVEMAIRGPDVGLLTPISTLWSGLVIFSAIRAEPALSLTVGGVAALEVLGVGLAARGLGGNLPEVYFFPWLGLRVLYPLLSGVAGAVVAHTFLARAERALSAVRERDLMSRYFLHEKIGAGGMAEVFRATYSPEGGFQKTVALKRILPSYAKRPHFIDLFLDEARLCALLNHPNVVQVFDCARSEDTMILAMEYVDGLSLQELILSRDRPLPLSAVTYLGAELAAGLDYLHHRIGPNGRGLALVHRDVNPPNVLISRFGEVKLGDFGIAHAAILTTPQAKDSFVGKSVYAAPEQRRCEPLDPRSDLFGLGLTLYEAITSKTVAWEKLPGEGKTDFQGMIPLPSQLRTEVPPALDAVVGKLLEFDKDARYARGAEVRDRLMGLSGPAAPFPQGQQLLAEAVLDALRQRFRETEVTDPEGLRARSAAKPASEDALPKAIIVSAANE